MEAILLSMLGYGAVGMLVGLLAGTLGIGGGFVMVPVLSFVFHHQGVAFESLMPMVAATSLAVIACTSAFALKEHWQHGHEISEIYNKLVAGLILGVLMGVLLGVSLHPTVLRVLLGVFLLGVAVVLFAGLQPKPHRELPGQLAVSSVFFLVGLKSGLFGLGGGFMSTPFLLFCNVPVRKSLAVASAASATIAVTGVTCFMVVYALHHAVMPAYTFGYVYLPAFFGIVICSVCSVRFGVRWAQKIPLMWLRRSLASFIFLAGLDMLFS